eukprot:Blabericola_migrator_1__177@NODE_1048_length_5606_cov_28_032858_g557_i2_p7_GENE_NODE_1048_length_5606_cov_28_032858_g557_i2NODE_1048_length_5606_cov_28_032858_g557_i2_p7_ORF_typecomplete_len121_score9_47PELOTA_1/PF15608_6/3_7PELOTA_1/PF15608_6/15_NODE_1048_length_5606_cov_28_032858_g557_i249865348
MFPGSSYCYELELKLINGERQPTVGEATRWMIAVRARYWRIRARRKYGEKITDPMLWQILRRTLPEQVLLEVERTYPDVDSYTQLAELAAKVEPRCHDRRTSWRRQERWLRPLNRQLRLW